MKERPLHPLTEKEEREIRANWRAMRSDRGATLIRVDVLRLLATLDAARAKTQAEKRARAHEAALEAWAWLAHVHVASSASMSVAAEVAKAETCLSAAVDWERQYPSGATRWASNRIGGEVAGSHVAPADVDMVKQLLVHARGCGVASTLNCFMVAMGLLGERMTLKWRGPAK